MFRKLYRWLFWGYDNLAQEKIRAAVAHERLKIEVKERIERELIKKMIDDALDIANGKWITDVGDHPPVIPERRRTKR